MKIALLIIDLQVGLMQESPALPLRAKKACEHINYVASLLRSNRQLVVHVQDNEQQEDEAAFAIIPEVDQEPDDLYIRKTWANGFWNTELETILRNREIDLVIVSGFAAEHCALFTFNGAVERGFKTAILQKGVVSMYEDQPLSLYRDRFTISYPVVEAILGVKE
ncbi:isochorismatase family cysteine hydrolase [Gorillibacterium timonense]|uniref:isochorismatase family cysteine hydrolase n=1 Tax=Gorillibacterium timonense TaxID=1689269 RepID=UPI00071E36F5|nr:isochorismatase family cysteine hydrolase [Gorillibacterium timonense]